MDAWETGRTTEQSLGQLFVRLHHWVIREVWNVYQKEITVCGAFMVGLFGLAIAYKLGQARNPDVKLGQLMRNLKNECTKKTYLEQVSARYKRIIQQITWLLRVAWVLALMLTALLLLNLKSASLLPFVIQSQIDNVRLLLVIFGIGGVTVLLYMSRIWCRSQLKRLDSSARASAQNAEHLLEGLVTAFGEDLRAEIAGQLLSRLQNSHVTLQEKVVEIANHLTTLIAEEAKACRIQKFYEDRIQTMLSFRWPSLNSTHGSPNQKAKSFQSLETKEPNLKLQPAESAFTVDKKDANKKFEFQDLESLKSPRSQEEVNDTEHVIDRVYATKLKQWFKLIKQIKEEIESNPELCEGDAS